MKPTNIKIILLMISFTFIIMKFFNTPYNIYSLLLSKYETRMIQQYGYCQNESWGFYNDVVNKFNINNNEVRIYNDEGFVTLENLFNLRINNNIITKYVLILNYQSVNDESIYDSKFSSVKNYKIIHRLNNCYFMELND